MKELTKEQLNNLRGFYGCTDDKQVLRNGEIGYCKDEKTLVICCDNCGQYHHIDIEDIE